MLYRITYILSLLPFRLLFIISDVMAWIACDVLKYRRDVVRNNLKSSFPENDDKENRQIEKRFYKFLCDYFIETVKLASMSPKEMQKRMKVENIEEINEAVKSGQSVSLYLGHYCNWEWISSLPLHIDPAAKCAQIYHPLNNKSFDKLLYKLRTRFKANNIPMSDIMQHLVRWKKEGVPSVT